MPFHEIFSKKTEHHKPKSKTQLGGSEKPIVIIDYREKNSLVPAELEHLGILTKFENLKLGDFIVKDTIIERKTVSDFISSMLNNHLSSQLQDLQQIENKLLIIEGIEEQELYSKDSKVNENAVRGFLLSIVLSYKVPIIFTKNSADTARFIAVLSKKQPHEAGINAKRHSRDVKEQMQYIIEGFPGIGPKTAKKLLKEFGAIKNIIDASPEELEKLIGKKAEIFKIINLKY